MNVVRSLILTACSLLHFDAPLADRVAWCENKYGPENVYQLTQAKMPDFTFWGLSQGLVPNVADPSQNVFFSVTRMSQGELSAWAASENCWGYLVS